VQIYAYLFDVLDDGAIKSFCTTASDSGLPPPTFGFPASDSLFPIHIQDQALVEGFNFFKLQNAKAIPNNVPLFAL